MNEQGPIPRKRLIDGLKLVLPAVILVAICFGLLNRVNQTLLPVALDFATAAAAGITAGLTTRWSLKGRAGLLHAIVAIAMTISALIVLGVVTFGQAGIQMLVTRRDVDWNGLGQIMIGSSSALLGVRAFRRTIQILPAPERLAARVVAQPGVRIWRQRRKGAGLPSRGKGVHPRSARRIPPALQLARIIAIPRWRVPRLKFPHLNLPHIDFRRLFHVRDSAIKITGVTELRCPYCLDEVIKNDPRGVRLCSICHTPHHADCWAMTGMCQIPHYHT